VVGNVMNLFECEHLDNFFNNTNLTFHTVQLKIKLNLAIQSLKVSFITKKLIILHNSQFFQIQKKFFWSSHRSRNVLRTTNSEKWLLRLVRSRFISEKCRATQVLEMAMTYTIQHESLQRTWLHRVCRRGVPLSGLKAPEFGVGFSAFSVLSVRLLLCTQHKCVKNGGDMLTTVLHWIWRGKFAHGDLILGSSCLEKIERSSKMDQSDSEIIILRQWHSM
jgi:hypothetical protein